MNYCFLKNQNKGKYNSFCAWLDKENSQRQILSLFISRVKS